MTKPAFAVFVAAAVFLGYVDALVRLTPDHPSTPGRVAGEARVPAMSEVILIETLRPPEDYTPRQIEIAAQLASLLDRGRLLLIEKPGM